jgi:hypothetical protein
MGTSTAETGAGFNYDDETIYGEPTPTPDPSEIVSAEEQLLSEGAPKLSDYETVADYEDAMEGFEMRLAEARQLDKELSDKTSAFNFKMPSDEKLKKFSEATKELKQERQQVIRGEGRGVTGYGGPGKSTGYVLRESPYKITERGPSTADLEKLLLEGLKTSSQMRLTGFRGPRIRGLFG